MTDSPQERVPRDHSRIDVNEEAELRFWSDRFACAPDQLRQAVAAVGTSPEDVRIYLGK